MRKVYINQSAIYFRHKESVTDYPVRNHISIYTGEKSHSVFTLATGENSWETLPIYGGRINHAIIVGIKNQLQTNLGCQMTENTWHLSLGLTMML
jgi:hypothetical protein